MRSPLDWLSDFYGPERNQYLRLSEEDRIKHGIRAGLFFLIVWAGFAIYRWLA